MTVALIVLVFIVLCALMYTKKMNAMFALPILALLIALIAGIPWADTVEGEATVAGIQSLLFINCLLYTSVSAWGWRCAPAAHPAGMTPWP